MQKCTKSGLKPESIKPRIETSYMIINNKKIMLSKT